MCKDNQFFNLNTQQIHTNRFYKYLLIESYSLSKTLQQRTPGLHRIAMPNHMPRPALSFIFNLVLFQYIFMRKHEFVLIIAPKWHCFNGCADKQIIFRIMHHLVLYQINHQRREAIPSPLLMNRKHFYIAASHYMIEMQNTASNHDILLILQPDK